MDIRPTIMLVEDDPMLCDCLRRLFGMANLNCQCYHSAAEFLAAFDIHQAGCILIDLRLPGMSGLELQARLVHMKVTQPIIFITAHADVPTVVQAMKAGAYDFIQKPFSEQTLLDVVGRAAQVHVQSQRANQRLQDTRERLDTLTPRESEVLGLVVTGKSTRQVAAHLGLSHKTVDNHRANIMEKMGAAGVVELVRMVLTADNDSSRFPPVAFPSRVINRAS